MNHMMNVFDFAHSQRWKPGHPIPPSHSRHRDRKGREASGEKTSLLSKLSLSTLTLVKISLKAILFKLMIPKGLSNQLQLPP